MPHPVIDRLFQFRWVCVYQTLRNYTHMSVVSRRSSNVCGVSDVRIFRILGGTTLRVSGDGVSAGGDGDTISDLIDAFFEQVVCVRNLQTTSPFRGTGEYESLSPDLEPTLLLRQNFSVFLTELIQKHKEKIQRIRLICGLPCDISKVKQVSWVKRFVDGIAEAGFAPPSGTHDGGFDLLEDVDGGHAHTFKKK
eukprot:GDKI01005771.1.p1 GENE.GDKI01005771.1~~GDKI01005771.1.p1  ORF type:complete len:194 (+),score=26.28 GDKI01005771.1:165-746(+)